MVEEAASRLCWKMARLGIAFNLNLRTELTQCTRGLVAILVLHETSKATLSKLLRVTARTAESVDKHRLARHTHVYKCVLE